MNNKVPPSDNCTEAASLEEWRNWLDKNHHNKQNIWLIIHHKSSDTPSISYEEAVDEAICFGWIDSKPNKRNDTSYFQLFSKRNRRSNWSRVNKIRVERLLEEGRIQPSGLQMIEEAKAIGTWDALNDVDNLVEPDVLRHALDENTMARNFWNEFPPSVKRGILEWIFNARKPETRDKRIRETVEKAGQNIRANQYRQPKSK